MPKIMTVKEVKKGEYIHLLNKDNTPQKKVWIRGEYDRSSQRYELQNYWDINDFKYVKGDKKCIIADF